MVAFRTAPNKCHAKTALRRRRRLPKKAPAKKKAAPKKAAAPPPRTGRSTRSGRYM
jgi:hypothetical protein